MLYGLNLLSHTLSDKMVLFLFCVYHSPKNNCWDVLCVRCIRLWFLLPLSYITTLLNTFQLFYSMTCFQPACLLMTMSIGHTSWESSSCTACKIETIVPVKRRVALWAFSIYSFIPSFADMNQSLVRAMCGWVQHRINRQRYLTPARGVWHTHAFV